MANDSYPPWLTELLGDTPDLLITREEPRDRAFVLSKAERGMHLRHSDRGVDLQLRAHHVRVGRLVPANVDDLKEMLKRWVVERCALTELSERFPALALDPDAEMIVEGRIVEAQWKSVAAFCQEERMNLGDFLRVAALDPILRVYYPFTSHQVLLFSRNVRYPFDYKGLPTVRFAGSGRYVVKTEDGEESKALEAPAAVELIHKLLNVNP